MTEDVVMKAFNELVVKPFKGGSADFFYHLHVGSEVSKRGETIAFDASKAGKLAEALRHAKLVRLQFEENKFVCDQQATGRFWKVAQCAKMVLEHAYEEKISYDVFAVLRPDVIYRSPIADLVRTSHDWFSVANHIEVRPETYLLTFPDGAKAAASLPDSLTCCDAARRLPERCFILGLDPPRSNYILEDYFVMQRGFSCGGCEETTGRCEFPVQIIRTGALQFSNIQLKRLHGQIHTNVKQHDEPRVSDVLRWHELAPRSVKDLLKSMLVGAKPPQEAPGIDCQCFSTCDAMSATTFLRQIPAFVTGPQSPWYNYLCAVYRGPIPLPFALHRMHFFYHRDALWQQTNPTVAWPMPTCDLTQIKGRQGAMAMRTDEFIPTSKQPRCKASVCARWLAGSPGTLGNASSFPGRVVQDKTLFVIADHFDALPNTPIQSHGSAFWGIPPTVAMEDQSWREWLGHAQDHSKLGKQPGRWIEVIRVKALKEAQIGGGCWFWPAVGSGIWHHTGRVFSVLTKFDANALLSEWGIKHNISRPLDNGGAFSAEALALMPRGHPSFYKGDRFMYAAHELGHDTVQSACGTSCIPELISVELQCIVPTPSVAGCAPVDLRAGPSPSMTCSCADNDTMLNCNGAAAYKVGRDLAAKTSYASYYAGFEASFSMKLDAGYDAVLRRQRLRVMLPKKAIRDKTHKLQLIFFAGLEGSGHHLWEKVLAPCRQEKSCAISTQLSQALYHQAKGGLFALERQFVESINITADYNKLRLWRTPIEWERRLDQARAKVRTHIRELRQQLNLRLVIVNNALAPGSGLLSYPNYWGPMRSLQTPDVRLLAELCEIEGVDLRIVVLHRAAERILHSTVTHRNFDSLLRQAVTLDHNARMLTTQLELLDPSFFVCAVYEEMPALPAAVGTLFRELPFDLDSHLHAVFISRHNLTFPAPPREATGNANFEKAMDLLRPTLGRLSRVARCQTMGV